MFLFLATVCSANGPAWAAAPDDVYRAALQYKNKGMWSRALPLMQELADEGHIPAKTDLAIMLLPMRGHDESHALTRLSFTNETAALALLDEAVASGYGRAMITSADWHADHAAYRCNAAQCRVQHLSQAKRLHQQAASLGEHQSHAWLAYFYRQFCSAQDNDEKAAIHRRQAIDIYRLKRPRAGAQLADHWFTTYGVFAGHLKQIDIYQPSSICD